MHVLIAGGTGFIGKALCRHFIDQGHQVTVLTRSPDQHNIQTFLQDDTTAKNLANIRFLSWEAFAPKAQDIASGAHWLINLTGANIGDGRWTETRKRIILESRIETTRYLSKLCASLGPQSPVLFNASAVGVYGLSDQVHHFDESTTIDFNHFDCFLSEVGRKWEMATSEAEAAGVRTIKLRLGVVLGKGGVLAKLAPLFRLGLGGKIGDGQQAFPWIAMEDVIRAIDFIFEDTTLSGPINLLAPNATKQEDFAKAMGKVLHRPTWLSTPSWLLKVIYGQMAEELLLQGQFATPKRLVDAGFEFSLPHIEEALSYTLTTKKTEHSE